MRDFQVSEDDRGNLCLKPAPTLVSQLLEELQPGDRRNVNGVSTNAGLLVLQKRVAELEAICLTLQPPIAKVGSSRSVPTSIKRRGRADRIQFGWRLDPRDKTKLVPDYEELKTIARARALAATGNSLREVCRLLDKEGRTRRGKPWKNAHSMLATILRRNTPVSD
jgi:hypothetical protein